MAHEEFNYIIVFQSNYHGYYIEELFRRHNIRNSFRKAPRAIAKSCSTSIYILERDLQKAMSLIKDTKIPYQGIFKIIPKEDHTLGYQKVF